MVVSARTGEGLDELRALIAAELPRPDIEVTVLLPYDRGDLVNRLHREGEILTSEHTEHGTRVEAKVNQTLVGELAAYSI